MTLNLSFSAPTARPSTWSGSVMYRPSTSPSAPSAPAAKNYVSNGYVMNSQGYLANPSRSAQIAANNAGALTGAEASRMGMPLGGRR
jgi:hypothetical protein